MARLTPEGIRRICRRRRGCRGCGLGWASIRRALGRVTAGRGRAATMRRQTSPLLVIPCRARPAVVAYDALKMPMGFAGEAHAVVGCGSGRWHWRWCGQRAAKGQPGDLCAVPSPSACRQANSLTIITFTTITLTIRSLIRTCDSSTIRHSQACAMRCL